MARISDTPVFCPPGFPPAACGRGLPEAEFQPRLPDIFTDALIAATADRFGVRDLEYTWVEKETARLAPRTHRTHRTAANAGSWATFFVLVVGKRNLALP
jgi:hypothetical protein